MKKIISILSILFCLTAHAQETVAITKDSTGNAYVLFVRDDSIAVVFRGKHTALTTDGYFAKDFSAFDLKLVGFLKFDKIAATLAELQKKTEISVIVDTIKVEPIPTSNSVIEVFPKQARYSKSRYIIEPTDWGKVSEKSQRITGMSGYDFAPIEANKGENIWKYGAWTQTYTSIAGKRDIWREGNATYYLKPSGYSTNMSYNLMDFDLRFPDFSLPEGKYVIMQPTPLRERGVNNYLKKGVSFAKDAAGAKGYRFISDAWLLDLGCPPAYVEGSQEAMDKWCEEIDADVLLRSFINNVYEPNKNAGYVMLNWETVGNRWHKRQDKLIGCLAYWRDNAHTAKMALWTVSGIGLGRPILQGSGLDFSELLTFDGDLESFQKKYKDFVGVDFSYAKYADVGHIGGYMNYPIEEGVVHHYLTELLLHRKFNPGKPVLATVWFDMEFINNFDLERVRVDSEAGTYFAQVKPKVFPSVAFNWGVWTMLGDGFDCWSDPNWWSENKSDWGWGAKDSDGKDLYNRFGEHVSKYSAQPMKAIDWMMSGVFAMSSNKDIINAKTEWKFVTLPTKSFYDRTVLVAYKPSHTGDSALVLILDGFGKIDGETIHSIMIEGKNYDLKTYGRFTSVVRLKL
jgi:hypothetical protein